MWSYKTHIDGGRFMCYRLILYQAFIQTYPTMGYVASERYRSEESAPQNAAFAAVAYPFKAAAGLFMPAPQRRQSDGDLSPMIVSRANTVSHANTSTTTMNTPRPAPRMLDDHELPRPPIARNEKGLGSTWSDA